ncbi:hypothetical protein HW43_25385 [Escherichia coli]|nr:hypothetical protein HW43_25385 [Escherichia coli]
MCIVFDYPRTLSQRSLPVGLRSLLMQEYGDDTAHGYVRLKCLYPLKRISIKLSRVGYKPLSRPLIEWPLQ